MDLIQVLEPTIADQIAAGEVVNRPASVVKELLENAVDAGAKNITLAIVDAGQALVQVIDDGKGMTPRDAKMAFKRHATSKIKSAEDLWQLKTFGFRGEALASIASVAQVELKTKRAEDELGCIIEVNGGVLGDPIPTSCNNGTSITVKNLFFNTPARRKFLKTAAYERQVIILEFEKVAMANPNVGFVFQNENEPQPLVLRPSTLRERVGAIIKRNINKSLIHVSLKTEEITISGWTSAPSQSGPSSTKNSHFFVNGRFMRNMLLQKSVSQAYGKLLPPGQFPFFYIFIDIDPEKIDVNIHPTKTEIKFEDESLVWQMVNSAVRKALGGAAVAPTLDFAHPAVEMPNFNPNVNIEDLPIPKVSARPYNPFKIPVSGAPKPIKGFDPEKAVFDENMSAGFYKNSAFDNIANDFFAEGESNFGERTIEYIQEEVPSQQGLEMEEVIENHNIVAFQLPNGYIATPMESGLAIIDYRRALERITYERLLGEIKNGCNASQMELIPQQVELSQSEAALLVSFSAEIAKLGFEISDMGSGVIAVYAMPAVLSEKCDPADILQQIVEELENGAKIDDMFNDKIATAIAKGVAKQRVQTLTLEQMQNIVADIFNCNQPSLTNGGLTIINYVNNDEIEKRFKKR